METGTNGTSNGVSSRSGKDCRWVLLVLAGASRLAAGGLWAAAARAGCETRWSVYRVHSVTALARVQTRRSRPAHSLTLSGPLLTEDGSDKNVLGSSLYHSAGAASHQ